MGGGEGVNRTVYAHAAKEMGINWMKCGNCFGVSSSHYVKEDALARYYQDYYDKKDNNQGFRLDISSSTHRKELVTIDHIDLFAVHIAKYIRVDKKKISLLDYGGGGGEISYTVAMYILANTVCEHVDIIIVDYETRTIEIDTDKITLQKISPDSFTSLEGSYDIIIASAILEHIFFAGETISRLFQLLESGGSFYVRTPYIMPLYKFMMKLGISIGVGFPEHIHDFSNACFSRIPELLCGDKIRVIISQPSFFENGFKQNFLKALLSRIIRFPYYVFFHKWPFIGGWEVVWQKE